MGLHYPGTDVKQLYHRNWILAEAFATVASSDVSGYSRPPMSGGELDVSTTQPMRAATPLPWLLLGLAMLSGIGLSARMHLKWVDEKTQTALALKANDELMDRLRLSAVENERLRTQSESLTKEKSAFDAQRQDLEQQMRSLMEEIGRYRANPRCSLNAPPPAKENPSRNK